MAKKKLTEGQVAELRRAYESWNPHDPESETATELARRFGISKQTLYTYRDEWQEADRREREKKGRAQDAGQADAIVFLTAELVAARTRIAELERELERHQAMT